MPGEIPVSNPQELRSSTGGEDFRSVGLVPEAEKGQYANEIGVNQEKIDDILKTRNNSTGQLIRHGAEVVDKGNGDYGLRVTESQVENVRRQMNKDLKSREEGESQEADMPEEDDTMVQKESSASEQPSVADDHTETNETREKTMAQMYDKGAQTRMRPSVEGGTDTFFAPTAEQIDAASQEMQDAIRDQAEAIAETAEAENLTSTEMINKLMEEVRALREAVDKLNEAKAQNPGPAEDLGTTEDGEKITEDMLPDVDDFPEEVIAGLSGDEGEAEEILTEGAESEASPEELSLHESQENYLKLLAGRRRWFFGRPSEAKVEEARATYERARVDFALAAAEKIVDERYPDLEGAEREAMVNTQATAEAVFQEIARREAEDEIQNNGVSRKIFNWIKQHPRLRMYTGLALTGGAMIFGATGNIPGAAACIVGRSALAGIGTGLMVEGGLDRLQTGLDRKLRELTPEQIADMTPEQLREASAGMNAYEVRRGQRLESGRFTETTTSILATQEADLRRTIDSYIEAGATPEMARGRALTEFVNSNNVAREGSDLDERSKSLVRGITAGIAGAIVASASAYLGLRGLESARPEATPKPGANTEAPDVSVNPAPEAQPLAPPETSFVEAADSEWNGIEQAMGKYTAKNGVRLTPRQWNVAVDYIKDEMNTFNPHPRNWVPNGWTARFTDGGWSAGFGGAASEGTRGLKDAVEYALTHPNG